MLAHAQEGEAASGARDGGSTAGSTPIVKPVLRVAQELRRWTDADPRYRWQPADLSMTVAKARARGQNNEPRSTADRSFGVRAKRGLTSRNRHRGRSLETPEACSAGGTRKGCVAVRGDPAPRGVLCRHRAAPPINLRHAN